MDPLSALGLATSIVQFIDFTGKLVSKGHKIYKSANGMLIENEELDATTRKIIDLNNRVVQSFEVNTQGVGLTPTDRDIKAICEECNKIASRLVQALEQLKARTRHSKWQSFRQALKTLWSQHDVDKLKSDLDTYRRRLDTTLLFSLRERIDQMSSMIGNQRNEPVKMSSLLLPRKTAGTQWQADLIDDIQKNYWMPGDFGAVEHFSKHISNATESQRRKGLQSQLLDQLSFRDLSDRQDRIVEAHEQTFRWVLDPKSADTSKTWSDFTAWLEGNDDIYWMTGKAGSGKSTLMKYLYKDSRTRQHLRKWSGEMPLVTANFYFWNSGSYAQMSQLGFIRSILYEALKQRPSLVPKIFPKRWTTSGLFGEDVHPWTLPELMDAFDGLIKQTEQSFKLCLFIDGLDEFDGDHENLIELIQRTVSQPNVKVCLSSRPWTVFEDAFSQGPSLMLQDLTFPDIVRFTTAKLHGSRGFRGLRQREPAYASTLVQNIAVKSSGVFLWVALVVKSLLTGLSNCDRVSDLQRRLDAIPGDLEELYEKMFNGIDPFYAEHTYQLFQIAREAQGMLSALAFSFADEEDKRLAITRPPAPMGEAERLSRYETMKRRLNSRCKGFLEIPAAGSIMDTEASPAESQLSKEGPHQSEGEQRRGQNELPWLHQQRDHENQRRQHRYSPSSQNNDEARILQRHPNSAAERIVPSREVTPINYENESCLTSSPSFIPSTQTHSHGEVLQAISPADLKVAYLHRTARDFLESPRIRQRLLAPSGGTFNPQLSLLRSSVLILKTLPRSELNRIRILDCIDQCMKDAASAESSTKEPQIELLEEVDRAAWAAFETAGIKTRSSKAHWTIIGPSTGDECGFLALAAQYNLQLFIRASIQRGLPVFQKQPDRPILDCIILDYREYPSLCERETFTLGYPVPNLSLLKGLLDRGADPNEAYKGRSIWETLLDESQRISNDVNIPFKKRSLVLRHWSDVAEVFILHEADPLVNKDSQMGSRIREVFGNHVPDRAKNLEKLLKRTKSRWSALGKFIIPRTKARPPPSFEDITPLHLQNKLRSIKLDSGSLNDVYLRTESIRLDNKAKVTGDDGNGKMRRVGGPRDLDDYHGRKLYSPLEHERGTIPSAHYRAHAPNTPPVDPFETRRSRPLTRRKRERIEHEENELEEDARDVSSYQTDSTTIPPHGLRGKQPRREYPTLSEVEQPQIDETRSRGDYSGDFEDQEEPGQPRWVPAERSFHQDELDPPRRDRDEERRLRHQRRRQRQHRRARTPEY